MEKYSIQRFLLQKYLINDDMIFTIIYTWFHTSGDGKFIISTSVEPDLILHPLDTTA